MNIWLDSRYSLCEGGNHIKLIKQTQPLAYKEHAYDEIKQGIVSHLIPEGSLLSERVLSEQFGISRTPLREAIQRLELEGWVTSLPRKGIIVKSINLQDVKEVMQIRKANELLVIELLIGNITNEQIKQIRQQFIPSKILDEKTILPFADGDKFHIQLAKHCGNQRLLQLLKNLSSQMQWFGYWALQVDGRAKEVIHEHALILDAIKGKKIKKAQRYAIEHLEHTEAALLEGLKIRDRSSK
ncbi:GntR family transcriptional regulator [Pelosinus sp. sgz500959]|uniref:GntR family transcriptional regulator n=1 Tax=Pelosinus sp. sgz500959 TaxID=3242472 RepID=UPI0036726B68